MLKLKNHLTSYVSLILFALLTAALPVWAAPGDLDTTFSGDGIVVHHGAAGGNSNDGGQAVAVDDNNKRVVVGYSYNGTNNDMVIWRYNSDGTLDTSFSGDGIVVHHNAAGGNGGDIGVAVVIDGSGKIIVAGYSNNGSNNDMAIWRYNSDGTLDTSFSGDGIVTHN